MRVISLNLLRTLECVARHLSFARAAEELCVSPSAVSQQIKKLEEQLGVDFFRQVSNKLMMTEACVACLEPLQRGMDLLDQIPHVIDAHQNAHVLRVSATPAFATRWLAPRLNDFRRAYPDIDVWLDASTEVVDFAAGGVDLAVRYGRGRAPSLMSELLAHESVVPVASPELFPTGAVTAYEIARAQLLHDDSDADDENCPDWARWFEAAGVACADARRGLHFRQSHLVLDAALAGRGAALAKLALAEADLAAGRLVALGAPIPLDHAYYLVCPAANLSLPAVTAFRAWIHDQAPACGRPRPLAVAS